VQREQAATGDKKSHLVFAVAVFVEKFLSHRGFIRMRGGHADDIEGLITLVVEQAVDFGAIGIDYRGVFNRGFDKRCSGDVASGRPAFETYADAMQSRRDFSAVAGTNSGCAGWVSAKIRSRLMLPYGRGQDISWSFVLFRTVHRRHSHGCANIE